MKAILKKLIPLLIIAAIGIAAYSIWSVERDTGPGPNFASGNGRIEATEIDISTKLAGKIVDIKVDEGDFVEKGQVLAVMQTDQLEAQLNEAKAQVAKAVADEASSRAQVALRVSDVNAAQATVQQQLSELDKTQRRLERSESLSVQGVITGQQFDDDETTEQAAKAAVETAKAQVKVAEAAVTSAQADADGNAAAIKAAEATVARIQVDIDDSSLTAPRKGRVQYRVAQPGEVLAVGGRVLNFVDLSDVYMYFFLPETQVGKLAIGSEARIVVDAFPDWPIPAKITFVSDVAQFTPKTVETAEERQKLMFRVKAKIDPSILEQNLEQVKTGLPGVTWVRFDPSEEWPDFLQVKSK